MVGLFGGIILMFIIQLAVLSAWSTFVHQHRDQYFIFVPFMVLLVLAVSLFWLLERMSK